MFCDECMKEGDKPKQAEFQAVWPWGEQVKACAQHRLTLNQRAVQQLDQPSGLSWSPLNPGKPVELSRDERTLLHANILTRDDEIADRDRRIAELVRSNGELSSELGRVRNINTQRDLELKEARKDLELAKEQRDKAQAAAGAAIVERDRLELQIRSANARVLVPGPAPAPETPALGVRRQQQQAPQDPPTQPDAPKP